MSDPSRPTLVRLLFTVEEAAESLGIGRTTIYEEIKAGRLHPVHVGRTTRFPKSELERYVAALQRSPEKRRRPKSAPQDGLFTLPA